MLQSLFLSKIGGSSRVRDELTQALAEGRGVTAKVRWLTRADDGDGRNRWIHCTPLIGADSRIGVWMVVVVDDDEPDSIRRRLQRMAPPVEPGCGRMGQSKSPPSSAMTNHERPNFSMLNPDAMARTRSPAGSRMYNHQPSLDSSLELDIDVGRAPSTASIRNTRRNELTPHLLGT